MCRYAVRFGPTSYEYFTETDFEIFQVEGKFEDDHVKGPNSSLDKNSLEWVRADKFMVEDYDPSQIVTAADNDNGDKTEVNPITYDGDLSNWRINGNSFLSTY